MNSVRGTAREQRSCRVGTFKSEASLVGLRCRDKLLPFRLEILHAAAIVGVVDTIPQIAEECRVFLPRKRAADALEECIGLMSTNQDSISGELDMARPPLPTRDKSHAEEERAEHQVKDMVSGV